MPNTNYRAIDCVKTFSGASPHLQTFPEAEGQTFIKGDLVYLVSGEVTECATAPDAVIGIAQYDGQNLGSGVDGTTQVILAHPDNIFEGCKFDDTPGSAVTEVTDVGKTLAMQLDTGKWYIDNDDTSSHDIVRVIAVSPNAPLGNAYGILQFVFHNSAYQLGLL